MGRHQALLLPGMLTGTGEFNFYLNERKESMPQYGLFPYVRTNLGHVPQTPARAYIKNVLKSLLELEMKSFKRTCFYCLKEFSE